MNIDDLEILDLDGNAEEIDFQFDMTKQNVGELDQRMRIINEIYDTEDSYVQGLKICIRYYYEPLIENDRMIPRDKLDEIFRHFPDIKTTNSQFFDELTKSKEQGLLYDEIGKIFQQFSPYFKVYKMVVGNSEKVLEVLKECCESPEITRYLEKQRQMINAKTQLDLRSYLITPVQRLPRYNLLLTELIKNTEKDHKDYNNLVKSLESFKECTQFANDSVRERERRDKLVTIAKSCEGVEESDLVQPGRLFVKSGTLLEVGKKIPKQRFVYLFNDMLMYGNGNEMKLNVVGCFLLNTLILKDIKDSANIANCFRLLSVGKRAIDVTFQCATPEEKSTWYTLINDNIERYRKNTITLKGELGNENYIFVWIPDEEADECMRCKEQFSLFFRKHHCRNCGFVICANCREKVYIPKLDRIDYVCSICIEELNTTSYPENDQNQTEIEQSNENESNETENGQVNDFQSQSEEHEKNQRLPPQLPPPRKTLKRSIQPQEIQENHEQEEPKHAIQ